MIYKWTCRQHCCCVVFCLHGYTYKRLLLQFWATARAYMTSKTPCWRTGLGFRAAWWKQEVWKTFLVGQMTCVSTAWSTFPQLATHDVTSAVAVRSSWWTSSWYWQLDIIDTRCLGIPPYSTQASVGSKKCCDTLAQTGSHILIEARLATQSWKSICVAFKSLTASMSLASNITTCPQELLPGWSASSHQHIHLCAKRSPCFLLYTPT